MKDFIILFIVTVFFTDMAFGYDVKYYQKGQSVEQDGYLFSVESEKQLRLDITDLDYAKKLNISLENINKSYESQVGIMQERINNQQKEITELNNSNGFFSKYGMFILGVITATAVAFAVKKSTQ